MKLRHCMGAKDFLLPRKSTEERVRESVSFDWVDLLRRAELLYLVGGGYLTDLFGMDHFFTPIEVANYYAIKVESAPLGLGPFNSDSALERLREAFAGTCIKVRDPDSLAICKQADIMVEQCPDDGFRVNEHLDISGLKRRNIIGINYFEQYGANEAMRSRLWWRDLVMALKQHGVAIEGFCFHNQISSDFSKTVELLSDCGIAPHMTIPPDLDFRVACRRVASYRGIVTCRFHATVVANVFGVPTVATADGPYYTSKMQVAVAGTNTSHVVDPTISLADEALSVILSWPDL